MAKLKAAARAKVPSSEFGLPKERKYPMPDKGHAVDAKGRATQQVNKGAMSKATEAKIDRKANSVIDKGGADGMHHQVPGKPGHYQYK